ncbi:Alpha/Beta hydrolase protein [Mycena leptocephala]|nr:Alpha/Beta hydrolase protein [Mycena leptocephala]
MLTLLFFISLTSYSSLVTAYRPLVSLHYGTFEGATDGNLTKFLGVPFARPAARFELPQAPIHLHGVQNATAFGPACPQQAVSSSVPISLPNYTMVSEACLTLDVFKPTSAHPGSKLPVLVWLFGGGFEIGNSADTDFRPTVEHSIILGEPVVIVAPNYRLNAFGFLGGKEVGDAGITNLGLRDQIFALEWVQKHIEKFGGDPDRVVLGGFSAGAISTGLLQLYNKPKSHSLFRGAFMISGAPWPSPSVIDGQQDYDDLVTANNCTEAHDTLECLRRVPFEAFLSTVNQTPDLFSFKGVALVWQPRVDGDIIMRNPIVSVAHGAFAPIPILVGSVDDEATLFSFSSTNITTNAEFSDYVRTIFLPKASPHQISRVAALYPQDPALGAPFGTGNANQLTPEFKRIAAFGSDLALLSLRRLFLKHTSRTQNTWSWLSKRGKSTPNLGAFHGSDIPIFFPPSASAATDNQGVDSLINFINTLDPNRSAAPKLPLTSRPAAAVPWPKWNSHSPSLLTFSDPAVVNITADTFRAEAMNFLIGLHLDGVTVLDSDSAGPVTTPGYDEKQVYLGETL